MILILSWLNILQHSRESNPAHFSRNRYRFKVLQEQYRPSFHFNVVSLRMLYLYYLGSCHTFNPCLIVHIILIQAYWHCWSLLHAMALLTRLVLYSVRGVFVMCVCGFLWGRHNCYPCKCSSPGGDYKPQEQAQYVGGSSCRITGGSSQ